LITAEALRRIARRQELPVGIVEKDYAISWLLKEAYENIALKEDLLFKGGTALRKVYFPEAWRLSHDLDFTLLGELKVKETKDELEQVFRTASTNSGIAFSLKTFHTTKGSVIANIQFTGPLVRKNQLRMDITLDEKLVLEPEWRIITTIYPDLLTFEVKAYDLKEILVEKIRTIIQRGKSRDYYDVWRLLREKEFDVDEIRELLIRKCQINRIEYKPEVIFDDDVLTEVATYWQKALADLTKELPEFNEVILELKEKLMHKLEKGVT